MIFGRQRTTITREGVYYALVVLFILGGAALRQVDLLVVFAGLLVAPAIIHWRLVALTLRQLGMKRKFRELVPAGRPFMVSIELTNNRDYLGTWAVSVEDTVMLSLDSHVGLGCLIVPYIRPGGAAVAQYQATLPRRGQYTFGPMMVSTQFPLGLFRSWLRFYHSDRILALPRIGVLKKKWTEAIETRSVGRQTAGGRRHGNEGDFFALREWRTGDSRRWIHWRSSARLNYPVIRQLEQPQRREVGVIVDLWSPDDPSDEDLGWVELAVSFAATAVVSLIADEGHRVHVVVCAGETKRWTGEVSNLATEPILRTLALIEPGQTTDVANRIVELGDSIRGDSPLVVLSTRSKGAVPMSPATARRAHWVDVRSPAREEYFVLNEPETDESNASTAARDASSNGAAQPANDAAGATNEVQQKAKAAP